MLRPFVSTRFQILFTPFSRVLFTFPSRYWFTIGHRGVFSLGGWSPQFHTGFLVSRATQDTPGSLTISHTGLSPSVAGLPRPFCYRLGIPLWGPTTPRTLARSRFGLFPVRSPLLRESRLISLPPGTEMFHFPGLAPFRVMGHDSHWVSPFGHPRIKACFLLPAAFRRLLRPSSPLCAKASTVCPLQLAVLLFVQRCLSYSAVSMMLPSYFQPSSYIAC